MNSRYMFKYPHFTVTKIIKYCLHTPKNARHYCPRILGGSTDAAIFEDFIEQSFWHCRKWPESESVLIMDNASFYYSDRIEEICSKAGVKLAYLSLLLLLGPRVELQV